jgi:phenylpropionate dioxygenase-like ring-hydroxylating dioxygenase large terminal subunit
MQEPSEPIDGLPRNCTFDAADWHILARHWYPVALVRELANAPLSSRLLDEPLVIYQANGKVVVANDLCPHRGDFNRKVFDEDKAIVE